MALKYCALTYNGVCIDETIAGFTTINVEGRDIHDFDVDTSKVAGNDGVIFRRMNMPERKLKVYYLIKAANNKDRLEKMHRLNKILKTEKEIKIEFGDEAGYRMGIFESADNPAYDFYRGIGSLTIRCSKPYLYMPDETLAGQNITIPAGTEYGIEWLSTSGTVTDKKEVRIRNERTGAVIRLLDLPRIGQIEIGKDQIALTGESVKKHLDFATSTWKRFEIRSGDRLVIAGMEATKTTIRRLYV